MLFRSARLGAARLRQYQQRAGLRLRPLRQRAAGDGAAHRLRLCRDALNADSGLYLTQYRAYNPAIGRWLSRDPLGEGSDPEGNLYAYVGGNPLSYVDPNGQIMLAPRVLRFARIAYYLFRMFAPRDPHDPGGPPPIPPPAQTAVGQSKPAAGAGPSPQPSPDPKLPGSNPEDPCDSDNPTPRIAPSAPSMATPEPLPLVPPPSILPFLLPLLGAMVLL